MALEESISMGATGTYARALVVHVLEAGNAVGDAAKADNTAGEESHETVANMSANHTITTTL